MPKKKIDPIVVGIGEDPEGKLTVQKSLPLFALWRSELTLAEFKILDTYLSRIDSHKPERRTVVFEKGEIERLLEVDRIRRDVLSERIAHLGNAIKLPDQTSKKGFRLIWLFEEAECTPDENGLWQVKLTCSKAAMKYVFNIESLGYLRYKLRSIVNLKSRYSYVLFTYLEANRFRKTWDISVDELKRLLNCDSEATYKEFKFFNQKILQRCQRELHEKTECRFNYDTVKKGRFVVAVRFTLETLSDEILGIEVDPNQCTFDDYEVDEDLSLLSSSSTPHLTAEEEYDELLNLLSDACNHEFSRDEIVIINDALNETGLFSLSSADYLKRTDFLTKIYRRLEWQDSRNVKIGKAKISHRLRYILKMIGGGDV